MSNESKTAGKIKAQIIKFCEAISSEFKKPQKKFIKQLIYGIQASKDIKLSNISRVLDEEISLIKTENRLSRNLRHNDFTHSLTEKILSQAQGRIRKDTVLALDLSDVRKEYAKKMDNLTTVYNGSKGELANGWWILGVVGADVAGEELIPLYQEIFSQEEEGFISENEKIVGAMETINKHLEGKGIWVIDRGGDREKLFRYLLPKDLKFVIRLTEKRDLIHKGKVKHITEVVKSCRTDKEFEVKIDREGYEEVKKVAIGEEVVALPFLPDRLLRLLVIKGFGEEGILLLTNLLNKTSQEILEIYLTRWKAEESYRFIKQAYNLEDVRVRGWQALKNLLVLLLAVFYFVSVELGRKLRLNILLQKIYRRAKRFFGIPSFKHYAIADGIYALLFSSKKGIDIFKQKIFTGNLTLPLFPDF